jgi:hypothetical protein
MNANHIDMKEEGFNLQIRAPLPPNSVEETK